jgi:cytochrome c
MTFAGLSDPQERADVEAFLNSHSDSPQPLPKAPAAANGATGTQAAGNPPGNGPNNGPQKAGKEPVLTEQQTGANPKNVGGPGAPKVSGPASTATKKP